MNCKTCQLSIGAYIDEELTRPEMAAVRAHLYDCEACASEHRELVALHKILGSHPAPEPVHGFEERLVQYVFAGPPRPKADRSVRTYLLMASVALGSMALTFSLANALSGSDFRANSANDDSIAFQVRRDMMYQAGSDPMGGIPVVRNGGSGR